MVSEDNNQEFFKTQKSKKIFSMEYSTILTTSNERNWTSFSIEIQDATPRSKYSTKVEKKNLSEFSEKEWQSKLHEIVEKHAENLKKLAK